MEKTEFQIGGCSEAHESVGLVRTELRWLDQTLLPFAFCWYLLTSWGVSHLAWRPRGVASASRRFSPLREFSRTKFEEYDFQAADLVAFYLPMHTATRLAAQVIPKISRLNPKAQLCAYGLYASVNEEYLRGLGVQFLVGGEFEEDLTNLVQALMQGRTVPNQPSIVSLRKQQFIVPDRSVLPVLKDYSQLNLPDGSRRVVGYTEASKEYKHLCRHCPVHLRGQVSSRSKERGGGRYSAAGRAGSTAYSFWGS